MPRLVIGVMVLDATSCINCTLRDYRKDRVDLFFVRCREERAGLFIMIIFEGELVIKQDQVIFKERVCLLYG